MGRLRFKSLFIIADEIYCFGHCNINKIKIIFIWRWIRVIILSIVRCSDVSHCRIIIYFYQTSWTMTEKPKFWIIDTVVLSIHVIDDKHHSLYDWIISHLSEYSYLFTMYDSFVAVILFCCSQILTNCDYF